MLIVALSSVAKAQDYSFEALSDLIARGHDRSDPTVSISRSDGRIQQERMLSTKITELTTDGEPIAVFAENWIDAERGFMPTVIFACVSESTVLIHALVLQKDHMGELKLSQDKDYQLLIRGFKGRNKTRIPSRVVDVFRVPEFGITHARIEGTADLSENLFKMTKKSTSLQFDLMDGNRPTNYAVYASLDDPERHFAPFVRDCVLGPPDASQPTFRFGD